MAYRFKNKIDEKMQKTYGRQADRKCQNQRWRHHSSIQRSWMSKPHKVKFHIEEIL